MKKLIRNGQALPYSWQETLITTKQLGDKIQLSDRTILKMRNNGQIPFMRFNSRCIRYSLPEVIKALSK